MEFFYFFLLLFRSLALCFVRLHQFYSLFYLPHEGFVYSLFYQHRAIFSIFVHSRTMFHSHSLYGCFSCLLGIWFTLESLLSPSPSFCLCFSLYFQMLHVPTKCSAFLPLCLILSLLSWVFPIHPCTGALNIKHILRSHFCTPLFIFCVFRVYVVFITFGTNYEINISNNLGVLRHTDQQ